MSVSLIYLCAGTTIVTSIGFASVTVVWLRRLRETMAQALAEAASQQIRTAQHLGEAIADVQKQQETYNQQIHMLAQAGLRLQQELSQVSDRLDNGDADYERSGQTLH